MGEQIEINDIEGLLSSLLTDGKKLVSYEHDRLLPTGENYGSIMLRLKVNLKGPNGEETVHCVAKLVPPSPLLWKMFNIPVTFKKEFGMYKVIAPMLNKFGKQHGIENLLPLFPDFIGARISLDPKSDEIDQDALIVLKNMTEEGYVVGDRFTGFDRDTTILLLEDLATLHASGIAFKLANPKEFEEYMIPILEGGVLADLNEEVLNNLNKQIKEHLSRDEKCVPLIDTVLTRLRDFNDLMRAKPREPFGTLVHNDFWTNNMMVKFKNGKPVSTKFLDFQVIEYDNPLNDVLCLIYSSTRLDLLTEVDDFLDAYYNRFSHVLEQLKCDTTRFSKEAFLKEVAAAGPKQLIRIALMLQPLFIKKGKAKEISDMNDENDITISESSLHENYYPRLHFLVQDFVKRGWV